MKLQFCEQVICNFKAFEGEHVFLWDRPGVTFVQGQNKKAKRLAANGSGKSSLFDALCWCLFGRTPGGLKNPDVMPWSDSGNPDVTQRLEVDGMPYEIRRTASPNQLYINGTEASQERVEELIGLNFDLTVNTFLLAQGHKLFFDLAPKDKMALFSDTLQLERWDVRAKAASAAWDAADLDAVDGLGKQTAILSTIKELEGLLAETKVKAERWVVESRTRGRDSAKRLALLQTEFTAKDKELAGATLRHDGAETELAAIVRESAVLTREGNEVRRRRSRAEADAAAAERQQAECRRQLTELAKAKECPTCGQPVKPKDLAEHRAHLTEQRSELEEVSKNAIQPELLKAEEALAEKVVANDEQRAAFEVKADAAETEVRRLQPEVAMLKAQITELQRVIAADEANPHTAQIASLLARLKALRSEHEALGKEVAEATRRGERFKFWAKGFKDIKLQLIEDVLDELELATNSMLEEVGLVDWVIRYDIERETKSGTVQRALSVQINSPESKDWVRWESWSGGEQQRLRLIGALALADVLLNHAGVQVNIEILDEPALYWSSEGVQELCAFLADRARQTDRSIYYVEHNAVKSVHFSEVVTVARDKDGSYVKSAD